MATQRETVDFILEKLEAGASTGAYVSDAITDDTSGNFSTRAMFGEYALYANGKVVALICDDQLFCKNSTSKRGT